MLKSLRLVLCLGTGVVVAAAPMAWAEASEVSAEGQAFQVLDETLPAEEQVLDNSLTEQEFNQQSSENSVSPLSLTMVRITCESWSYRFASCYTGLFIEYVQLEQQHSRTACVLGSTWGYDANSIWVNNGCRATFRAYGYPR
jgi:hypothetical protein